MSDMKDGGPAFPAVAEGGADSGLHPTFNAGMSLRDWFAGQAMAGLLACPNTCAKNQGQFAKWSYNYADAMLAARGSDESV